MRMIDRPDARDFMNKSVAGIYKEENDYFEQVFYILMLSLPINLKVYILVYILATVMLSISL